MTEGNSLAEETSARHVVMLVANGVVGDSRVQKIAWSMADAGWRVTLVGRAPGSEVERFRLKDADVVLVPVPKVVSGYEKARLRRGVAPAHTGAVVTARAGEARHVRLNQVPCVRRVQVPGIHDDSRRACVGLAGTFDEESASAYVN